jgi:NADH-quinone oxidoreductase subunit L
MIWGTLAAFIGMGLGWWVYRNAQEEPLNARVLRNKFYFDELYAWLNRWTQEKLSHIAVWFDRWVIAGAGVKGLSGAADITGSLLRLFQSGNLQAYALLLALGLLLMLGLFLF